MAMTFNGNGDKIDFGQPVSLASNSLGAVSVWIKTTQGLANENVAFLTHSASPTGTGGWYAIINSAVTNKASLLCYSSTFQCLNISSTTSINDGNWHHIFYNLNTSNAGNNSIWIDGVSEANANTTTSWSTSGGNLTVGQASDQFWGHFLGSGAEVAYWTGINLDAAEIVSLAKGFSAKLVRPTSLKFYAPLIRSFSNMKNTAFSQTPGVKAIADHPRMVGGAGQGGYANSVVLNADDRGTKTGLFNSKRQVLRTGGVSGLDSSVRASRGIASTGNGYFELYIDDAGGVAPDTLVGVGNGSATLSNYPGADANGWGYYQHDGKKYTNLVGTTYGSAYSTNGDIVMCAYNNGKVWFGKNGVWNGDPVAGTGEAFSGITGTLIYPMIASYRWDSPAAKSTMRFHPWSFTYAIPSGYTAWDIEQPPVALPHPNLTPNGFDGWSATSGWTAPGGGIGKGSSAVNSLSRAGLLTIGTAYHCEVPYSATSTTGKLRFSDGGTVNYLSPTLSPIDTLSFTFTATGNDWYIQADTAVFSGTLYGIELYAL